MQMELDTVSHNNGSVLSTPISRCTLKKKKENHLDGDCYGAKAGERDRQVTRFADGVNMDFKLSRGIYPQVCIIDTNLIRLNSLLSAGITQVLSYCTKSFIHLLQQEPSVLQAPAALIF